MPLIVYPYGKRFTDWPHAILRWRRWSARSAPGWRSPAPSPAHWPAWVLGAAVGLWIGGFDLIYACQDAEVDREIGVRSVPARYGLRFALHASTVAHAVTFGLFVWFGVLVGWAGLVDRARADRRRLRVRALIVTRTTCPGSTGPSSRSTARSASRSSCSPCSTW